MWDPLCLYISPILYYVYTLANLPSTHQCMPPACSTLCIKFHLPILTWLTNEWTHKTGVYCPFQYSAPIFNFIHCWILTKYWIIDYLSFLLSVVCCTRGERCLFNPSSARLYFNYIQANVVNLIIIYTLLVFLCHLNCANFIYHRLVFGVKSKTPPSIYYSPNTHHRCCNRGMIIMVINDVTPGRHCSVWWE